MSGAVQRESLRYGPLGKSCMHVCVDMQRMFAEKTPWNTPWMPRVVSQVRRIVSHHPVQTLFTRFIPADHPGDGVGTWQRYYEYWSQMTLEHLERSMIELVPELSSFVPPAMVIDKRVYSPWLESGLHAHLQSRAIDTLVVSGGETDVCVLSTVLGAVDRGYRVVIAVDALCSSSDETHEALLKVYETRFSQQIETVVTDVVLASWKD